MRDRKQALRHKRRMPKPKRNLEHEAPLTQGEMRNVLLHAAEAAARDSMVRRLNCDQRAALLKVALEVFRACY